MLQYCTPRQIDMFRCYHITNKEDLINYLHEEKIIYQNNYEIIDYNSQYWKVIDLDPKYPDDEKYILKSGYMIKEYPEDGVGIWHCYSEDIFYRNYKVIE